MHNMQCDTRCHIGAVCEDKIPSQDMPSVVPNGHTLIQTNDPAGRKDSNIFIPFSNHLSYLPEFVN
jgi:hypothetical protein